MISPAEEVEPMDLAFHGPAAARYTSVPQRIRQLTEHWVGRELYCPGCGYAAMTQYGNNRPVADFFCGGCRADYELKSQAHVFGASVADGAYRTMIERLNSSTNPNLILMHYDPRTTSVVNLIVVPRYFFIPGLIVKRPPLAASARRAGWIGCNISLTSLPQAGRIFLIRNRIPESKVTVLRNWKRTLFIHDMRDMASKGWLLSVMRCIEQVGKPEFSPADIYRFKDELRRKHPANQHVEEKIRQKLQVLRDKGFLHSAGKGVYRLTAAR